MFFNVAPTADTRFPNNNEFGWAVFNCDQGWERFETADGAIFAKGYADNTSLSKLADQFDQANEHYGNFCLVKIADDIQITHSKYRSFPLSYHGSSITNLYVDSGTRVWANRQLKVDSSWQSSLLYSRPPLPAIESISLDQAVDQIFDLLVNNIRQFVVTHNPNIKLFCSGGVDTTLLYALFRYINYPIELIVEEHWESDYFLTNNQTALDKLWGYSQLHHWSSPTWLATGSCGDEYFLRGPEVIARLTAWHNINFSEVIEKASDHYHYQHFNKYQDLWKNTWANRNKLKQDYPSTAFLHAQILNILSNDHQHWHLGNTITYTPFNNLDIAKILLQLNISDLMSQFTDASITKLLIQKVDSTLCSVVSSFKNHNPTQNLAKLMEFHTQQLSH
jgi:hypothetical protein